MEKGGHPKRVEKDTYNGCRNNTDRQCTYPESILHKSVWVWFVKVLKTFLVKCVI